MDKKPYQRVSYTYIGSPIWEVLVLIAVSFAFKVLGDAQLSGEMDVSFIMWLTVSLVMFVFCVIALMYRVVSGARGVAKSDLAADSYVALNIIIAANCMTWFFVFDDLLKIYQYYDFDVPGPITYPTNGQNVYLTDRLEEPLDLARSLFAGNLLALLSAWIYYRKPQVQATPDL